MVSFSLRTSTCFSLLTCAALLGACATTPPATTRATRGQLVDVEIHSVSIKGNLMHESPDRAVSIYLPPSYAGQAERRYPVLYLLHGIGDSNQVWTRPWKGYTAEDGTIPGLLDAEIAAGRLKEMIVVMPSASTNYPGCFYTNSEAKGRWEDFITKDLVGYIDATYRTRAAPASRGLAGHSMGGYGAIKLGMKHPDLFSAVYGMNPALLGWGGEVSGSNPAFNAVLAIDTPAKLEGQNLYVAAIIGISEAFSPNPAKPPFFADYPFAQKDGQMAPAEPAHGRWQAEMPLYMAEHHVEKLRRLRGLRFDSAFVDEFAHIPPTSEALSHRFDELGVAHTFEMYNGDHRNRLWGAAGRLATEVLPYFSRLLE